MGNQWLKTRGQKRGLQTGYFWQNPCLSAKNGIFAIEKLRTLFNFSLLNFEQAMSRSETLLRRNRDIIQAYHELYAQGFRLEVCCEKLSKRFYLSSVRVYMIIWESGSRKTEVPEPARETEAA
jgi:hypothetical protein